MHPSEPVTTVDDVANLLETVARANALFAAEVDRIAGSRALISQASVDRLARLADRLRPGEVARAQLSELDPEVLLAGTSVWLQRRRCRTGSAAARAQARWGGLSA